MHFIVYQSRAFGANRPRLGGKSTTQLRLVGGESSKPVRYGANIMICSGANSPDTVTTNTDPCPVVLLYSSLYLQSSLLYLTHINNNINNISFY
jgi:hypothetical protein